MANPELSAGGHPASEHPRELGGLIPIPLAATGIEDLRLSRFSGQTPQYWLNLQSRYDLDCAQDAAGGRIKSEVHPRAA
jgi:hypothetical protein